MKTLTEHFAVWFIVTALMVLIVGGIVFLIVHFWLLTRKRDKLKSQEEMLARKSAANSNQETPGE